MSSELKKHWFTLRLLLLLNAILICMIFLMHGATRHSGTDKDCNKVLKNLSVDALNSVTIKMM